MRKHSIRVSLDAGTDHDLHQLALRESRPVAQMAYVLIKNGLYLRRQQLSPERNADQQQQS